MRYYPIRSPECVEEIRKLHTLFNARRAEARNEVKSNIKKQVKSVLEFRFRQ